MSAQTSKGVFGLLKRGWNEIPEVIGSSAMGLIGIGLCGIGFYTYVQKDGNYRRHKLHYTVIRDDDPDAEKYRQFYKEMDSK